MTATGPNLTSAQAAVEQLMQDACTVTREAPLDRSSDVLNLHTLELERPAVHSTERYAGPCKFKHQSSGLLQSRSDREGTVQRYQVSLPLAAELPVKGDRITITACTRLPEAVGLTLRVVTIAMGTYALSWKCDCELWEADQ